MAAATQSAHSARTAFEQCIVSLSDIERHGLKGITDEELNSLGASIARVSARLTGERVARAPERFGNNPITPPNYAFRPPNFDE